MPLPAIDRPTGVDRIRSIALLALSLSTIGCRACPSDPVDIPGPTMLAKGVGWDALADPRYNQAMPASGDRIAKALLSPIVDIHTHTFNARYLPIRNIILGKRDAHWILTLVSNAAAGRLAHILVSATRLTPIDSGHISCDAEELLPPGRTYEGFSRGTAAPSQGEEAKALQDTVQVLQDGLVAIDRSERESLEEIGDPDDLSSDLQRRRLEVMTSASNRRLDFLDLALEKRSHGDLIDELRKALGALGIGLEGQLAQRFLYNIVTPDGDVEARLHRDFQDELSLSVSMSLDLGPVYAYPTYPDTGGIPDLLPYSEQLRRLNAFQSRPISRMIYFAGYNPFRDHGKEGQALAIIKNAVENQGAWGVKFYSPSGFRPSHNVIPGKARALFTSIPGKQWEARYGCWDGKKLDKLVTELLDYCEENDLPIFAHCLDGEFEARKGYAECMADPKWWAKILEDRKELRVCFAHAGHPAFWFGSGEKMRHIPNEDWGRMVYELCVKYPNVYCGFGVHGEAMKPRRRSYFIALLDKLIQEPKGDYPIESKIIYGSDWYMPVDANELIDYLRAYQAAFTDRRLIDHYEAFFSRNALAYLNVSERLASAGCRLPKEVQARLQKLVDACRPGEDPIGTRELRQEQFNASSKAMTR